MSRLNKDDFAYVDHAIKFYLKIDIKTVDLSSEKKITLFFSRIQSIIQKKVLSEAVVAIMIFQFDKLIKDYEEKIKDISFSLLKRRGTKNGIKTSWKNFEKKVFSALALLQLTNNFQDLITGLKDHSTDESAISTWVVDGMQPKYKDYYYSRNLIKDVAQWSKTVRLIGPKIEIMTQRIRRL